MIEIIEYKGHSKNKITEVNLKSMNKNHLKWMNVNSPTEDELAKLGETCKINAEELESFLDINERPAIRELEHFSLVIFKSPYMEKYHVTNSIFILISKNLLITFCKNPIKPVNELFRLVKEEKRKSLEKGTTFLLYRILDSIQEDYYKILDKLEDEIGSIEDHIFQGKQATLKKIFKNKKIFLFFQKGLAANRDVLTHIEKHDVGDQIHVKQMKHFRYLYEECLQLHDLITTYRDLLSSNMEMHLSVVSNNLNKIMKRMTAFGSLILIPTLIAGIYGMNFVHTPEFDWRYGYYFAWGFMLLSVLMIGHYFKRKEYF